MTVLEATVSLDSPGPPNPTRRSECPVNVHFTPTSFSIAAECSPVYAPIPFRPTSSAPTEISLRRAAETLMICTAGQAITTSLFIENLPDLLRWSMIPASWLFVPLHFQLPPIHMGRAGPVPCVRYFA